MATKLIVLYTQPENPEDFDRQYFEIHVPLTEKMPGLRRMEVSKITGNIMGGSSPYYMIAELLFDNAEALNAAMSSPEGKAAAKNIMSFAANYITMLTSEVAKPEQVGAY